MPLQSRPVIIPNPDPSLYWAIPYEQALDLRIVLDHARDLLVSVSYRHIEGLYRMRWPLDKNGNLVPPDAIPNFLDEHNVNWSCFCMWNGLLHLARFVTKPDGTVMVYCGYEQSRCPFRINLTRIYQTTRLRGDNYGSYPTFAARGRWETAVSKVVEIADERNVAAEGAVDGAGSAGAVDGNEEGGSEIDDGHYHYDHDHGHHHHDQEEHGHGADGDDDYDGHGYYECCGEPKPNPKTFVVPILDGWLGHYPRHPRERTLVGEWQPGRYGWPIGEIQ